MLVPAGVEELIMLVPAGVEELVMLVPAGVEELPQLQLHLMPGRVSVQVPVLLGVTAWAAELLEESFGVLSFSYELDVY